MRPTSPRFWRFNRERYTLTGAQCANCGERFLTPRLICPQCHSEIEQVARDVFPYAAGAGRGAGRELGYRHRVNYDEGLRRAVTGI